MNSRPSPRRNIVEGQLTSALPKKQNPEEYPRPSRKPAAEKQPSAPAPLNGPSKDQILLQIIDSQLYETDERCLEFEKVERDVAYAVIAELENTNEHRSHRYTYNPLLNTFAVVTMPTKTHECHSSWFFFFFSQLMEMGAAGFLPSQDIKKLRFLPSPDDFSFIDPYSGSRKEPDTSFIPEGASMPTIIVEAGWSESRKKLHDDMRIWLKGGRPFVQLVFVIKWTRGHSNNKVKGDVETFALGANGPVSIQKEIIFPAPPPPLASQQTISLTKEILRGQSLPTGQDPTDSWAMSLDDLRSVARDFILDKGLTPA